MRIATKVGVSVVDNTKTIEVQRRLLKYYLSVEKSYVDGLELRALSGDGNPENPELLANGMLSKIGLTPKKIAAIEKKKGKQSLFELILFLQAIEDAVERMDKVIAEIEARMHELLDQIEQNVEAADRLDNDHSVLEEELEYFQRNGEFDINGDEQFNDVEAEALIARYELETGQKIDRTDPASYSKMMDMLMEIDLERRTLRDNINRNTAEYEFRKEQLDEAREIKADLESGDVEVSADALKAYESFGKDFERGYQPSPSPNVDAIPCFPIGSVSMDISIDETSISDDTFSFGFPPLQSEFSKAHDGVLSSTTDAPELETKVERTVVVTPVTAPRN